MWCVVAAYKERSRSSQLSRKAVLHDYGVLVDASKTRIVCIEGQTELTTSMKCRDKLELLNAGAE